MEIDESLAEIGAVPTLLCTPREPVEVGGAAVMAAWFGRNYLVTVACNNCRNYSKVFTTADFAGQEMPRGLRVQLLQGDTRNLVELLEASLLEYAAFIIPTDITEPMQARCAREHPCARSTGNDGRVTIITNIARVAVDPESPFLWIEIDAPLTSVNVNEAKQRIPMDSTLNGRTYELKTVFYRRKANGVQNFLVETRWGHNGILHYDGLRAEHPTRWIKNNDHWAFRTGVANRDKDEMWSLVGFVYMRR